MIRPALHVMAIISPRVFHMPAVADYCYDVTDERSVYFELGGTLEAGRPIKNSDYLQSIISDVNAVKYLFVYQIRH